MDPREELVALRRLAELEARQRGLPSAAPQETYDPAEGMSTWQKLAAGVGKAVVDTGRGLGQLVGLTSQQEIDDAKKRDAALMDTGAGMTGNVLGNIGMALAPGGAAIRGGKALSALSGAPKLVGRAGEIASTAGQRFLMPQTVPGAIGVGATQGFVQPVASDESRALNTAVGGIGGGAAPLVAGASKVVGNLAAPFTQAGRDRIVGRTLERFAGDPAALRTAAPTQYVKGSVPTLPEYTGDAGMATLYQSLRNNVDAKVPMVAREGANRAARVDAVREIAGDTGKREFFDGARKVAAEDLYGKAFAEQPTLTPWIKGQMTQLLKRPAFNQAWKEASTIAANEGVKLNRQNLVQVAHYTKMALDDQIANTQGNTQRAIMSARDKLLTLMESKDFAPAYREARATFAEMSKPINEMDVGQALLNKLEPALASYGATTREHAGAYAQALRDANGTAARATGFKGAKLDQMLSPEAYATAQGVAKDLGRSARASDLGLARGSPTAQNLVSQDILRQSLGPFGLPRSFTESSLAETLMRPASFAYKVPERKTLEQLGNTMVNDAEVKRLLALLDKKRGRLGLAADYLLPLSAPVGAAGLLNFQQ